MTAAAGTADGVSAVAASGDRASAGVDSGGDLKSVERAMVEQALANARFNKSQAARALGITRAQLYARLRHYGMA